MHLRLMRTVVILMICIDLYACLISATQTPTPDPFAGLGLVTPTPAPGTTSTTTGTTSTTTGTTSTTTDPSPAPISAPAPVTDAPQMPTTSFSGGGSFGGSGSSSFPSVSSPDPSEEALGGSGEQSSSKTWIIWLVLGLIIAAAVGGGAYKIYHNVDRTYIPKMILNEEGEEVLALPGQPTPGHKHAGIELRLGGDMGLDGTQDDSFRGDPNDPEAGRGRGRSKGKKNKSRNGKRGKDLSNGEYMASPLSECGMSEADLPEAEMARIRNFSRDDRKRVGGAYDPDASSTDDDDDDNAGGRGRSATAVERAKIHTRKADYDRPTAPKTKGQLEERRKEKKRRKKERSGAHSNTGMSSAYSNASTGSNRLASSDAPSYASSRSNRLGVGGNRLKSPSDAGSSSSKRSARSGTGKRSEYISSRQGLQYKPANNTRRPMGLVPGHSETPSHQRHGVSLDHGPAVATDTPLSKNIKLGQLGGLQRGVNVPSY